MGRPPGRPRKVPIDGTADPTPPKKRKKEPVDLHTFTTDGDLVDVWERRMLHPSTMPSLPIRLITPGMHIRWINMANTGRYQRARYQEGWVPVKKEELQDEREIYGVSYTVESFVCRGERQQEMLMKMPEAVWKKIRQAKYNEVIKSNKRIRDDMQSAGAKHFSDKYSSNEGHEIADRLSTFKGEIRFGSEAVEPDADEMALVEGSVTND